MNSLPSLILEMTPFQILSVLAYVESFALFESLLVFGLMFLLSLLLPARIFSAKMIPNGTAWIVIASSATALIHLYKIWKIKTLAYNQWILLWMVLALIAIGLATFWIDRNPRLEKVIRSGAERLSVLSFVYFSADALGLLLVLSRNVLKG